MLIASAAGEVRGYIIAQPIAPLLVPAPHEITAIGVVDDFYDEDFADISIMSTGASSGANLLAAAESAFAQRAIGSAVVVCRAGWSSKISLLEQRGYRTAKLWMLRALTERSVDFLMGMSATNHCPPLRQRRARNTFAVATSPSKVNRTALRYREPMIPRGSSTERPSLRALRVDRAARGYDDFFNNLLGRQYAVQALGKVADIMRYAGLVFTRNCLRPHAPRQTPPWPRSPIYPWEIVLG
jgi:hypothetical protein